MKKHLLIFYLLCSQCASQKEMLNPISVSIQEASIRCENDCKILTINTTFRNNSDENFLMYGMRGMPASSTTNLDMFCDLKNVGTGNAFALYDSKGNQLIPELEIFDLENQKKVTREMFDSVMQSSKTRFLESRIVFKGGSELTYRKQMGINNFSLPKGTYYIQLVYYCGQKIFDVLNRKEFTNEELDVFQGCIYSQKIPVIIE
jgi:hypothetical protein